MQGRSVDFRDIMCFNECVQINKNPCTHVKAIKEKRCFTHKLLLLRFFLELYKQQNNILTKTVGQEGGEHYIFHSYLWWWWWWWSDEQELLLADQVGEEASVEAAPSLCCEHSPRTLQSASGVLLRVDQQLSRDDIDGSVQERGQRRGGQRQPVLDQVLLGEEGHLLVPFFIFVVLVWHEVQHVVHLLLQEGSDVDQGILQHVEAQSTIETVLASHYLTEELPPSRPAK